MTVPEQGMNIGVVRYEDLEFAREAERLLRRGALCGRRPITLPAVPGLPLSDSAACEIAWLYLYAPIRPLAGTGGRHLPEFGQVSTAAHGTIGIIQAYSPAVRCNLHLRSRRDNHMNHSLNACSLTGIRASPLCTAAAIAGLLALAGCAATPQPPHRALQSAEMAITQAERTRVAEYAPAELNQAREKLAAARTAVRNEQMVEAETLAEESRVHADLASARAEMIQAKAVNVEMQKSIDTLKQEMQRSSGERP